MYLEPAAVVAEIYRVLKPGGIVYAETPFMQQVHEGAWDFARFTELGHRWLWRQFDEIDRGVIGGPGLSLYWSARYFCRAVLRRRRLADLMSVPFFVLSAVDHLLPLTWKIEGATGVCFLGRRAAQSIAARRTRFLLSRSAFVRLVQHLYAQWRVQPPIKSGASRLACGSCS